MRPGNLRAIAAMLAAVGAFALMDAAMKRLAGDYPPFQVVCLRAVASLPFLLVPIALAGRWGELATRRPLLHLFRGVLGLFMLGTFIYALSRMSLGDAYSIYLAAPLVITALSVPFLGDRVTARRWVAIAAGLAGVLVVLRPTGDGLATLGGLAVVGSMLAYSASAITIRVLGRTDSSTAISFWLMVQMAVGAAVIAAPGWRPVDPGDLGWVAFVGLVGAFGQLTITYAFRHAPPSVVAPFEYTAIVWGVALDFAFWDVLPVPGTLLGAAIVIAAGLYVFRDERRTALTAGAGAPGTRATASPSDG